MERTLKVLELYSGIGGMHYAVKECGLGATVINAMDINEIANCVYKHNFSHSTSLQRNIMSLSSDELNTINADVIAMSPPCQPFTRVGLKKDINDGRTDSLLHLLEILPNLNSVQYILLENVKGFEESETRDKLLSALSESNFNFQEFILSPHSFLVPNTRHRYYIIAKRKPRKFCFDVQRNLMTTLPFDISSSVSEVQVKCKIIISNLQKKLFETLGIKNEGCDEPFTISNILENGIDENIFLLNSKILARHAKILDIVTPTSTRSCCFTKAYSKYIEGTGSVFSPCSKEEIDLIYKRCQCMEVGSEEYVNMLKTLKIRFFTPKEIARLMCFPEDFSFPNEITNRQKYRLLGNSINVHVVAILLVLLLWEVDSYLW